ncbi:hypothetical protein Hdeb2414_s0023g00640041 [Helianthus debilis subsp. tardiflorus]
MRKAVSEAHRRPFFSTLLGFRHNVQICHFVPISRRQVIARVGFRHCVQILNYLGFRRTICGSADFGIDLGKLSIYHDYLDPSFDFRNFKNGFVCFVFQQPDFVFSVSKSSLVHA